MATLDIYWYGRGIDAFKSGDVDWLVDTIKVALLDDTHVVNQGAHQFWSEVSADEVVGAGYTAGGETLTTPTQTYDPVEARVTLDGDGLAWDPSTISARYVVIYKDTGVAATSPLIGFGNPGALQVSDGAAFTITWNAAGILRTTASAFV